MRVRKIGNYGRGKAKITLILAIEPGDPDLRACKKGSVQNPRMWYRLSTDAGTSTKNYVDFLNLDLMDYFKSTEKQRTILHDNLSSHKSDEVVVKGRCPEMVLIPPLIPKMGDLVEAIQPGTRTRLWMHWGRDSKYPSPWKEVLGDGRSSRLPLR